MKKIETPSKNPLPERIYAEVFTHAKRSLRDHNGAISSSNVLDFYSDAELTRKTCHKLKAAGFEIVHVAPTTISIAGTPETFRRVFGTELRTVERALTLDDTSHMYTHVDSNNSQDTSAIDVPQGEFSDVVEHVAIHRPSLRHSISATPPEVPYFHLRIPQVVDMLNARAAHRLGITGRGVRVVVVDSGFYDHPYFQARGWKANVILSPGAKDPHIDEVGHGTMVCANVMALAPDASVTVMKQTNFNIDLAFKMAADLDPDVLQNTWGFPVEEPPLNAIEKISTLHVADAIRRGIIVVFAGGNGGILLPPQMPEVLAVGGTFKQYGDVMQAASYASGYVSQVFLGRIVPDVCGLVGLQPLGVYLMMPTEPASDIDRAFAEKPYPEGDDTAPDDGWVCISGTSAGSAQIAGICALLKQADWNLEQKGIKRILCDTARQVYTGVSAQGNSAGPMRPNLATGFGVVDALAAVKEAIRWRRGC